MTSAILCLTLALAPASLLGDDAATELHYSGTLEQISGEDEGNTAKRFDVYTLVTNSRDQSEIAFLVNERGGGGWPWPERFGVLEFDAEGRAVGETKIRLLHTHEGTRYPIPLTPPLFADADRLQKGAAWKHDDRRYEVLGRAEVNERKCWQVRVTGRRGHRRTLWIERNGPVVVKAQQTVVMGRGDEFRLTMNLDGAKPVDAQRLAKIQQPLQTLLDLKQNLQRKQNEEDPVLSEEQLETAENVVATLQKQAASTPFEEFVAVISRDVQSQQERDSDLSRLAERFVGKQAPELDLTSVTGKDMNPDDLEGKVVVLHFWNYDGETLNEPYGQVGYLDYMHNQRAKLGVQVIGVAVDSRLGDPDEASSALQNVRKLKRFMRLRYPIAVDEGSLLKKFGDPREFDADLPLWVVIGPEGKIAYYKVGFFEINPDEGLKELDEAVVELLRKQRNQKEN